MKQLADLLNNHRLEVETLQSNHKVEVEKMQDKIDDLQAYKDLSIHLAKMKGFDSVASLCEGFAIKESGSKT